MEKIKLICFDLDQTLITQASWYELGLALGVSDEEDKRLFAEYTAGRLTNQEWNDTLLERYMEHPDANREGITHILSRYTLTEGAREAVEYLKAKKYELALIRSEEH